MRIVHEIINWYDEEPVMNGLVWHIVALELSNTNTNSDIICDL
jgi:hypothetical protein